MGVKVLVPRTTNIAFKKNGPVGRIDAQLAFPDKLEEITKSAVAGALPAGHLDEQLPGGARALRSLEDNESHRKRLRDRPPQDGVHERLVVANDRQADGIQAALRRIKDLAAG